MANYYGNGRSNYVKLKSAKSITDFQELCEKRGMYCWVEKGKVGCGASSEYGEPLDNVENEDTGEVDNLPDFFDAVSKLLKKGEVFVWQHVGNEKLRYINGYSYAIDSTGKSVRVDIQDIYKLAEKKFKVKNITQAEY